ncbi:hypothetical protein MBLNU230_g5458t1 [Neophaeotheca triangularis]
MALPDTKLTASDLGLGEGEDEALDVLDLPQLYQKPPARSLLTTLFDLSSAPPSWEASPREGTPHTRSGAATPLRPKRKIKSEGVPNYLTKIIASPLAWIEDDEVKEQIWESASQRLSERSGRSGMGAISRSFSIPLTPTGSEQTNAQDPTTFQDEEILEITLHEPALTSDNLGLKTWASSYLLAKRLVVLRPSLPSLPPSTQVLELGSGTGLVGIAAATILQHPTLLTDLPPIVPNLTKNTEINAPSVESLNGGRMTTATLDWDNPSQLSFPNSSSAPPPPHPPHTFPLILAADPLYSPNHPALLTKAIAHHLSPSLHSRLIIELPLRDAWASERADLKQRLRDSGLVLLDQGEEVGYDDWVEADNPGRGEWENGAEGEEMGAGEEEKRLRGVRCWWGVWGWGRGE